MAVEQKRTGAIAVIPARGGSKGIPGKNLKQIAGVSLLARTVAAARAARRIDQVCVSSDDPKILAAAAQSGATPITRPPELSGDDSSSEDAVLHALDCVRSAGANPDVLVLLQCTSPFTTARHIDGLVAALDDPRFNASLTVTVDHAFLWSANDRQEGAGVNHDASRPRVRRQSLPAQYRETGQGYAFRTAAFGNSKNRFCPPVALVVTSHPPIEIDEPSDLKLAEAFATIVEGSAR